MPLRTEINAFLLWYPQIYFACHRRYVRDKKAQRSLSLNQARIIDHLDDVEPTSLHSLARHMGVTSSTMSINVDRLEKAGYLRRMRDGRDARCIELRLTAAGNRIKQQQKTLDPDLVANLLKELDGPARKAALHGLELLGQAATAITAHRQAEKSKTNSTSVNKQRSLQ